MYSLFQFVILLLLVTDLIMLWSGRILMLIRLSALQGALLAALLLLPVDGALNAELVLLSIAVFCLKGVGFPVFLRHVCHKLGLEPVVRPRLGRMYPMAGGLVCLAFSLWLEGRIPAAEGLFPPMLFPVALTTLFCGLILVVGRAKALAQVIGYLVVENGIFLLGIPLMTEGSVWFELSILLDVFAAIFVMAIAINHINSAFDSIDVARFRNLRD
ncbi:hydrogenase-4 component E [uncultured Mailhella sp.]|uniref:hydrogenase-4 component E n=1 Tax=uncultured Mailhella sp. TaxID=1981031 RepID=UPI0025CDBABE|nr:hydrogenase-4 component E [uncultured Mailhella sp.]